MKQKSSKLSVLALLALTVAPPAWAMPPEYQVNVREGCRRAVAGAYLKAYDEKERTASYQASLKEQVATLKEALTTAQTAAKAAATQAAGHDFDATLAARRDDTAVVVKTLSGQMADYQQMMAKNAPEIAAKAAAEKRLRAAIETVFQFTRTGDLKDGGYPTQLAYRSSCPKYRALCPLPAKDREALSNLRIEGSLPEACQKYAGQSHLP